MGRSNAPYGVLDCLYMKKIGEEEEALSPAAARSQPEFPTRLVTLNSKTTEEAGGKADGQNGGCTVP